METTEHQAGCGSCLAASATARLCPRCTRWLHAEVRALGGWLDCHVRFDAYYARRGARRRPARTGRVVTRRAAGPPAGR